jgi:hypothetical protein
MPPREKPHMNMFFPSTWSRLRASDNSDKTSLRSLPPNSSLPSPPEFVALERAGWALASRCYIHKNCED